MIILNCCKHHTVHICIVLYYTHSTTYPKSLYYKGSMEYKHILLLIHHSTCMYSNKALPLHHWHSRWSELNIINIYWLYTQICWQVKMITTICVRIVSALTHKHTKQHPKPGQISSHNTLSLCSHFQFILILMAQTWFTQFLISKYSLVACSWHLYFVSTLESLS